MLHEVGSFLTPPCQGTVSICAANACYIKLAASHTTQCRQVKRVESTRMFLCIMLAMEVTTDDLASLLVRDDLSQRLRQLLCCRLTWGWHPSCLMYRFQEPCTHLWHGWIEYLKALSSISPNLQVCMSHQAGNFSTGASIEVVTAFHVISVGAKRVQLAHLQSLQGWLFLL